jgi:tetratricopeptide (TPR) repeat protein
MAVPSTNSGALKPLPSPAGRSASSEAARPQTLPIVQNSRRPDVPRDLPTPPTGAPSPRTALSNSAGSNAGTVFSEADHFQLALYYQRSGDFDNALRQYSAVLQRDELNPEAHNNLGLLYRDKGLYDEAVKEFVRAIAINQRYVKAHNNLGVTYLGQAKNDNAASEFRTALGIDPRNVESLVNLSLAERSSNREDARASLVRALAFEPRNAEAHYNFGLLAEEMGDKAAAVAHYRAFKAYATDHLDLFPQVQARIDALSR